MDELIVADSSPLISFARAGRLQIIHMVNARVIVPSACMKKLLLREKANLEQKK